MAQTNANAAAVEQHSLGLSIALHLLPGVLILLFYVVTAPLAVRLGFPPGTALFVSIAAILIPFELGYLFYQGRKRNGTFSLKGIVLFREPMPWWHYIALGLPLFMWLGVVFVIFAPPLDKIVVERLFTWVPDWFFLFGRDGQLAQYLQVCSGDRGDTQSNPERGRRTRRRRDVLPRLLTSTAEPIEGLGTARQCPALLSLSLLLAVGESDSDHWLYADGLRCLVEAEHLPGHDRPLRRQHGWGIGHACPSARPVKAAGSGSCRRGRPDSPESIDELTPGFTLRQRFRRPLYTRVVVLRELPPRCAHQAGITRLR